MIRIDTRTITELPRKSKQVTKKKSASDTRTMTETETEEAELENT